MPTDSQGTTIEFGTSLWSVRVTSLTPDDIERGDLELSDLSTVTWEEFDPTDLINAGGCEIEWNNDLADLNAIPYDQAKEEITITWPKQTAGSSNPAKLVVDGYMNRNKPPTAEMKALLKGSGHIKFSGQPVFTDET